MLYIYLHMPNTLDKCTILPAHHSISLQPIPSSPTLPALLPIRPAFIKHEHPAQEHQREYEDPPHQCAVIRCGIYVVLAGIRRRRFAASRVEVLHCSCAGGVRFSAERMLVRGVTCSRRVLVMREVR